MKKRTLGLVAAGLMLALCDMPQEGHPQAAEPLVASYLSIQRSLAADSTAGVSASAQKLATEARHRAQDGAAKRALLVSLAKAAEAMQGGDLKTLRAGFKELSRALVAYLGAAPVAGLGIYDCPMAKAQWVQKTGPVANPYLGKAMATCGTPVKK